MKFFEALVLCAVLLLKEPPLFLGTPPFFFGAPELFFMAPLGFRNLSDDIRDLDQVFSQLDLVRLNFLLAFTEPLHDRLSPRLPDQEKLHGLFEIH